MPEQPEHMKDMLISLSADMALESEKAALTLEQIVSKMQRSGMGLNEIESLLLRDLREGGQIFGDFRKNFKSQMRYGIEESGRGSVIDMFKDVELWDWVGISDKKICPDCLKRHNMEPQPYPTWQRIGLPGNGGTICGRGCRCTLVPDDSVKKPDGGIVRNLPPKIPSFAPAKTVQDAEKWAKDNVGILKSETKLDVNSFNLVNKQMNNLKKDWNSKLRFYGEEKRSNVYASANSAEMSFNSSFFNNTGKFKKEIKNSVEKHWNPRDCDTIKSIVDHEFAHTLTNDDIAFGHDIGKKFGKIKASYSREMTKLIKKHGQDYVKQNDFISSYAKTNTHEFVSESFTMVLNSPNPSRFAQQVYDLMQKQYGKTK